jgi:hypothetical protein
MSLLTTPLSPATATPFAPGAADGPAFGPLTPSLQRWLAHFAAAVRAKDFAAGEALCDPGAVSFGTVCARADSLAELVERQWGRVWPRTAGFDFDYATAVAAVTDDLAVVLSTWASVGFDRTASRSAAPAGPRSPSAAGRPGGGRSTPTSP